MLCMECIELVSLKSLGFIPGFINSSLGLLLQIAYNQSPIGSFSHIPSVAP
jgi:hypothetical protein